MKLTYYGTAAAEGFPAMYCRCDNCEEARRRKGQDIRTRSQAMVNDDLLIDFPSDTFDHILRLGLPLEKLSHCLITHAHRDHLCPDDLKNMGGRAAFGNGSFHLYGSAPTGKLVEGIKSVEFTLLSPQVPCEIAGYTVTPLRSWHAPELEALCYLIEQDGKALLYAHDTCGFDEEGWEALRGKHLDLISLDCTYGTVRPPWEVPMHMDLSLCVEFRDRLCALGCVDEHTVCYVNHFSHNGGEMLYREFSARAGQAGFSVSFDGLEVEVF